MDANMRAYYWDRLLRAHVRGAEMSAGQRQDLADAIHAALPSERTLSDAEQALSGAAVQLLDGSYDIEQWVRYAKANKVQELDRDTIRAEQGINVREQAKPLEERLAALLES